jgi:hypothetical protein
MSGVGDAVVAEVGERRRRRLEDGRKGERTGRVTVEVEAIAGRL